MEAMSKRMTLSQMEPIAREATRQALRDKDIPESLWDQMTLGSGYEDAYGVFELYVPGPKPQDAKLVSRTKVHRDTGEATVEVLI
jgi:hypothetical protein